MKIRNRVLATLVALVTPLALFAQAEIQVEDQPAALEKAQSIHNVGKLRQTKNGHLYLKVSDQFISEVLPLIECEGRLLPPKHFSSKRKCCGNLGAHFSVISHNEIVKNELWNIEEVNKHYGFNVQEIKSAKIDRKECAGKYWVLTVVCEPLTALRTSYNLPEKYQGHEFYIVIAKQMPCRPTPCRCEKGDEEGMPDLDERLCKEENDDTCEEAYAFATPRGEEDPCSETGLDEEGCNDCEDDQE